jgi:hypothetical protein
MEIYKCPRKRMKPVNSKSHNPVQLGVLGFVHNTPAALTDLFENLVVGNDCGDQESLLYDKDAVPDNC